MKDIEIEKLDKEIKELEEELEKNIKILIKKIGI